MTRWRSSAATTSRAGSGIPRPAPSRAREGSSSQAIPGRHHDGMVGRVEMALGADVAWSSRVPSREAGLPFAGLSDLFGDLVDADELDPAPPQRLALDVALMRAAAPAEPIQPLAISLAVLELLRASAARQPIAIAVDDAQWLDESTAGVLGLRCGGSSARPWSRLRARAGRRTTPPASAGGHPPARLVRLPLEGLGGEDIDRLLDESLGVRLAPTALRRVHRLSGGNPFHALEIGRAMGADPSGDVTLPDSLGRLIRERLAGLTPRLVPSRSTSPHSQPTEATLEAALGADAAGQGSRRHGQPAFSTSARIPSGSRSPSSPARCSPG